MKEKEIMNGHPISRRTAIKYFGTTLAIGSVGIGFPGILKAADTVKIGFLAPLTGHSTDFGVGMMYVTQLAVEEVNAQGGAGGRKVELIIEDDQMSPKVTVDKTQKLIFKDNVDVIMGLGTGGEMVACRVTCRKANQLMMTFTTQDMSPPPCYPFEAGVGICINQFIDPLATWLVKNMGKNIYLVGTDDIWPRTHAKRLKMMLDSLGGKLVGEEYFPYATQDFGPSIRRILKAQPDAVYVVFQDDVSILMKQYRGFGGKAPFICPILSETYAEGIGEAAENTIVCSPYLMSVNTPENKTLLANMKRKYPEQYKGRPGMIMVTAHGEGCYTQVWRYKLAIEKAGSVEKEKVVKAIPQLKFNSPQGPVVTNPKNLQRVHNMRIFRIVKDSKADFGYRGEILWECGQINPIVPICDT